MQQQIFIHLEKHYLPYVEKQIVCYSFGTWHYSGLFQMLHEETGNALSKYEDCTEKLSRIQKRQIRVKLKTCWFWQGAVLLLQ